MDEARFGEYVLLSSIDFGKAKQIEKTKSKFVLCTARAGLKQSNDAEQPVFEGLI